jgi:hypothetical protein
MLFITASCANVPELVPTPVSSSTPPIATFTPSPTKIPSSTPRPTKTLTLTPDFNDPAFQPQSIDDLQGFVLYWLNQGKKVSELSDFFYHQDSRNTWINGYVIDFDGDGKNELFFDSSLLQENSDFKNVFWIAKEVAGQYHIEYSQNETAQYGAKVELTDDLNQDSLPDLIFSRPTPGGYSGADIFIVRLENTGYVIRRIAYTEQIIDKIRAGEPDLSENKQLIITGFQPGWGSSGPGRTVEETFSAKDNEYEMKNSRFLPSKYRIHVLQDAQIAYETGDNKLAVKLWEQAAHDTALENFSSMQIENDVPEKYQPAYAVYRLYTYFLITGDEINAQKYLRELNNKYPEGSPGGEFITLAHEAKSLLDTSHDPVVVCKGIYDFMNATDEYVNFLIDNWYWGDHNLNIVDFCPVREN